MAGGAIIGTDADKLTSVEAGQLIGVTRADGVQYLPKSLTDRTSPTKHEFTVRETELMLRRLAYMLDLQVERVASNPLRLAVESGHYRKADSTQVTFAGNASFGPLPTSTTGYKLWIDVATNTVAGGTSWPANEADYVPLAECNTNGSEITSIEDRRNLLRMRIPPSGLDTGTTSSTTFTLDSDNAGAGADTAIRGNRGTTAADWQIEWNETDDRFEFEAELSGPTLANINVLGVLVGGVLMLDSQGAAKVAAAVAGDGLTHASGVLSVNVDGTTIETVGGTMQLKDGAVSAAKLEAGLADRLVQVSIGDASGSGTSFNVTIQMLDAAGNNLAAETIVEVGVFQDASGAADATNATIDNSPVAGTFLRWVTSGKIGLYRTNSSGTLTLDVALAVAETVYVLAGATRGSPLLDCDDIGTVTKTS